MTEFLAFISKNKEWIFSGIGVSVLYAIYAAMRVILSRQSAHRYEISKSLAGRPAAQDVQEKKEPSKDTVEYIANIPLDPNITSDELAVLKRSCNFPRSQFTQGYRLDWIFEELVCDVTASTLHLFLESLFNKGYLAKQRTDRGNIYYRLSDDGVRYLVDNKLVQLGDT